MTRMWLSRSCLSPCGVGAHFGFSSRGLLVSLVLLTALGFQPVRADFIYLNDGSRFLAGIIGEADGVVSLLDEHGKERSVPRSEINAIDPTPPLPPELARQAARLRLRFTQDRQRAAHSMLEQFERAQSDAERASWAERLAGFREREALPAYAEGLSRAAVPVASTCLERLRAFESPAAVVGLIKGALEQPDTELAQAAGVAAFERQPDLARRLCEYAALASPVPQRLRAIETLGAQRQRQSVPSLVRVMRMVQSVVRTQLVRTKRLREVPVTLGGGANVTIELPEIELIQVMTSTMVPVVSLERLEAVTAQALETISGQQFGTQVEAWERWWQQASAGP